MHSFQNQNLNSSTTTPQQSQSSILRLSQKIFDLNKSHQTKHVFSEYSSLHNKVYDLQNKLLQSSKFVSNAIKTHRESLIQRNQKLIQNQSRYQLSKKARSNQIKQLTQRIRSWISTQKRGRIQIEEKMLSAFEQKMQALSLQLAVQIDNRKSYLNSLDQKLQYDLPGLKQQIAKSLQTQALILQQITKRLDTQIESFKQTLQEKDNQLNMQTKKVMDLLGSTVTQIKGSIQVQKRERDRKKNQIMDLFEGAYKKLMF